MMKKQTDRSTNNHQCSTLSYTAVCTVFSFENCGLFRSGFCNGFGTSDRKSAHDTYLHRRHWTFNHRRGSCDSRVRKTERTGFKILWPSIVACV